MLVTLAIRYLHRSLPELSPKSLDKGDLAEDYRTTQVSTYGSSSQTIRHSLSHLVFLVCFCSYGKIYQVLWFLFIRSSGFCRPALSQFTSLHFLSLSSHGGEMTGQPLKQGKIILVFDKKYILNSTHILHLKCHYFTLLVLHLWITFFRII